MADCILAEIVSKAALSVFQIGLCCITSVKNIVNCFVHPGIPDGLLLVEPRTESLQNGFFLLEAQLSLLFIITGVLLTNGVLYGKQTVAVLDTLYCRLAVIILLSFRNGINKIPADMCSAGTALDPGQTVVPLITVGFQIPAVAFHEFLCMAAAPGRGITIQDERRKPILTASEQPHK